VTTWAYLASWDNKPGLYACHLSSTTAAFSCLWHALYVLTALLSNNSSCNICLAHTLNTLPTLLWRAAFTLPLPRAFFPPAGLRAALPIYLYSTNILPTISLCHYGSNLWFNAVIGGMEAPIMDVPNALHLWLP